MASSSSWESEGPLVSSTPALSPDAKAAHSTLSSSLPDHCVQNVTLIPLSESHSKSLFANLGGPQNANLYKYIPDGPLNDLESFTEHIKFLIRSPTFFPFAILSHSPTNPSNATLPDSNSAFIPSTPIAMICLMNIVPAHRTIEIGHVLFGPTLQRTTAATEALYLLMKHAFEDLGYRRVEWKANNLNEPSKRAALRLGFVFEGVFRKHMVVKGRNRDTAWFSVTDEEWEGGVKAALEKWLEKENFDVEGRQRRKLEEVREGGRPVKKEETTD